MSEIAPISRSKAQARATYDRRSRSYERLEGRFEHHARVTGEQLLALAPHEQVLEIGSGPGMSLAAFARAVGPDGHVIGVDISPEMHRVAVAQLRERGVAARVLRPAGRVGIVSLTATEPPALMERAYPVAHRLMPRVADCRPIPLGTLITEAGFTITDQQRCDIVGIPVAVIAARAPTTR